MARECEVCRNFKPERAAEIRELVEMKLDVRAVTLCSGHARIAANAKVRTLAALRALYGSGRRSYVARRSDQAATKRERRANRGRRASDHPGDSAT
jgi:hypothetical protein